MEQAPVCSGTGNPRRRETVLYRVVDVGFKGEVSGMVGEEKAGRVATPRESYRTGLRMQPLAAVWPLWA